MLLEEIHSFTQQHQLTHKDDNGHKNNNDNTQIETESESRKRRKGDITTISKTVAIIDVDTDTETTTTLSASLSSSSLTLSKPDNNQYDNITQNSDNKNNQIPIIVCGDFNMAPSSGIYSFITSKDGELDLSKVSPEDLGYRCAGDKYQKEQLTGILTHPLLGLKSAYHDYLLFGDDGKPIRGNESYDTTNEPTFTTYASHHKGTLDYIFFHPLTLRPLRFLNRPGLITQEQKKGLPNSDWGSDHLLVGCEFAE